VPTMPKTPDLKKTTADLKKSTAHFKATLSDPKPLYAVAGVGDLAVAKLRELPTKVAKLKSDLVGEEKSVQAKVTETVTSLPSDAMHLTARLGELADKGVKKADAEYAELATRGEAIVKKIRSQKATQDLLTQAQNTVTRARIARGAAARGAANTKTATKSTVTSAKKTAAKATKAASDAGDKIGQ
jgi:heparin binding hemagglutinin HbhA